MGISLQRDMFFKIDPGGRFVDHPIAVWDVR